MADNMILLSSRCANDPNAREFADVLARHLPKWGWDLDYCWDAAIPPRDQWEAEALALARHLEAL